MIEKHIRKRERFLENVVLELKNLNHVYQALKIFLDSSKEFREKNRFPYDMTSSEYHKMLDKEFKYQKEKVMDYVRNLNG